MTQPVIAPAHMPIAMEMYDIIFVFVSISSPFSASSPNLAPTNTWSNSFGETIAVDRANDASDTVGIVLIAPLDSEYGNGHNRIMIKSLMPSCLSVSARAAKRGSRFIRRETNPDKRYRETRNEQELPTTVAEATINQLHRSQLERSSAMYCLKTAETCHDPRGLYANRVVIRTYPLGKP